MGGEVVRPGAVFIFFSVGSDGLLDKSKCPFGPSLVQKQQCLIGSTLELPERIFR